MTESNMTLGQRLHLSRQQAEEMEDDSERAKAHAVLAQRGACCSTPGCFGKVYVGSVCAPCSREQDET